MLRKYTDQLNGQIVHTPCAESGTVDMLNSTGLSNSPVTLTHTVTDPSSSSTV